MLLMLSALASSRSVLELVRTGSVQPTEGQPLISSDRGHHCSPPPTKTLLQKPNTGTNDTITEGLKCIRHDYMGV